VWKSCSLLFFYNIIDNNKIDRLFNYIVKLESKIPKEFEMYEEKILDVLEKFYEKIFCRYTRKALFIFYRK